MLSVIKKIIHQGASYVVTRPWVLAVTMPIFHGTAYAGTDAAGTDVMPKPPADYDLTSSGDMLSATAKAFKFGFELLFVIAGCFTVYKAYASINEALKKYHRTEDMSTLKNDFIITAIGLLLCMSLCVFGYTMASKLATIVSS